jgi:hypothetical protein
VTPEVTPEVTPVGVGSEEQPTVEQVANGRAAVEQAAVEQAGGSPENNTAEAATNSSTGSSATARASNLPEDGGGKKSPGADPLVTSLKPAIVQLAEGRRALSQLKLTAAYRQRVRRELDLAQKQIDALRSLIE